MFYSLSLNSQILTFEVKHFFFLREVMRKQFLSQSSVKPEKEKKGPVIFTITTK